jgi:hypothetical protein
MDARRLHTGVSRAYTRSRIQYALTLQLELGLFVRIRAYSDNLLSYEYGSNVRLALLSTRYIFLISFFFRYCKILAKKYKLK